MTNLSYQNKDIAAYFASNRIRWDQFYPSERKVIAALAPAAASRVLDIGCGCGGLGLALAEAFGVQDYTGVEINTAAVLAGRQLNPNAQIYEGDVLHVGTSILSKQQFDLVFSLSCVDWNVEFEPTIAGIQRLKKQSQANSEEEHFIFKTDGSDLKVYFGDASTHSGNFVFNTPVTGTLAGTHRWPVKEFLAIMDLVGDKKVKISEQGATEITVDSGIATYVYLLPANKK